MIAGIMDDYGSSSSQENAPKRIRYDGILSERNRQSTRRCSAASTASVCVPHYAATRKIEGCSRILHHQFETHHDDADPFTSLPSEVITHVLSYLPLRDRKSARLTCQRLNECSKHVSIAKGEKLVFPGSRAVSSSHIREILLRTNYQSMNLEFYGSARGIRRLPDDVWKLCGNRVRSLYFECALSTPVLVDIFQSCRKLQVFAFKGSYPLRDRGDIPLDSALDQLIQFNVVCSQLHTLTFSAGIINTSLLYKIFTVFPNIEHLNALFGDVALKRECLKPLLAKLKGLSYYSTDPDPASVMFSSLSECQTRLTELHMSLRKSDLESDAGGWSCLRRFLAAQDGLQKLSLKLVTAVSRCRREKLIMFHALRSCPKLRQFEFETEKMYLATSNEVSEFLALISNLRLLKLNSLPCIESSDGLSSASRNFALKLNMLEVKSGRYGSPELLLHILKHSPKMQDLVMTAEGNLTIGTFQEALKKMPTLRTLKLSGGLIGDEFSTLGVPDDDCPIEGLENLEYLEVWLSPYRALPIRNIHFRRMKHVKLVFHPFCKGTRANVMDEVHEVLWNMPTVETVELPQLKLMANWHDLFQHLKGLRRLICGEVESHNLKPLFKACSTLNLVSAQRRNHRRTFSFDSSAERVICERYLTLEEIYNLPLLRPPYRLVYL